MKQCIVKNCKEQVEDAWLDIIDNVSGDGGRCHVCDKHFDLIHPYIQKKEKEMQKKHPDRFFAFAPLQYVEEALNQ